MPPLIDRLVQAAGLLAVLAIIVLSLLPGDARPHTGAPSQGEHVVAYLIAGGLHGLRAGRAKSRLLLLALGFIAGAGALEWVQLWIPGRNSQLIDVIASSIGALIGLGLGAAAAPLYRRCLAHAAG